MIQLNLLPDVKLQYIRARQRKRLVIGVSVISAGFFITIFLVLFSYVRFAQQTHMKNLNKDIASKTEELKGKEDLNKVLTIQNQLDSLPGLHDKKVISSRLFDYLTQLTPTQATISDVEADFASNTLTIKGNADELSTVNKFADTLKFTGFQVTGAAEQISCTFGEIAQSATVDNSENGQQADDQLTCRAFSEVVLKEFSLGDTTNSEQTDKKISYDLTFKFDSKIFANIKPNEDQGKATVSLKIPQIISTRSVTEKPGILFKPQPEIDPALLEGLPQ